MSCERCGVDLELNNEYLCQNCEYEVSGKGFLVKFFAFIFIITLIIMAVFDLWEA